MFFGKTSRGILPEKDGRQGSRGQNLIPAGQITTLIAFKDQGAPWVRFGIREILGHVFQPSPNFPGPKFKSPNSHNIENNA